MLNSYATWNDGARTDLPSRGCQVDTDKATTLEVPFSFASQKFHLENKLEDGKSIIPSEAIRKQSEADNGMISAMDSVDQFYDEPRSPVIFPHSGMRVRGWKKDVFKKYRFKYPIPIFR